MLGRFSMAVLLVCASLGPAQAATEDGAALSLRGFGTVGLARSSSDRAEFVRDLSQPVGIKGGHWSGRIDTILGLQANWQATPDIELVGQVVSRLRYDRSRDPELMWAFVKWESDPRLTVRAGRIGADFMMLADSRLVGYSYLPVRPPTDFFGPLFFSHFDGADVSGTLPLGAGLIRGKLFGGWTQEKSAGALGVWDTRGSPVAGLVADYLTGPWQFRMNAARIRFASDMNIAFLAEPLRAAGATVAADSLITRNTASRFLSLGVVHDRGPLQVQGMVNRIRHETEIFENSRGAYLLAGYRLGTVTPFAGISRWKTTPGTYAAGLPAGHPLNEKYSQFMTLARIDRTTYSVGARWDFHADLALKVQWDAVRATADTRFSFRNPDPAFDGKTDVLSVTLDFVF